MAEPDPYLTAEEVRARRPRRLTSADDPDIVSLVARFEDIVERYLDQAFREREATHTGRVSGGWLELPHHLVTAVELVDSNDNDVTLAADALDSERGRVAVYAAGPLTATYTHGETDPPELLLANCALYCDRMVSIDNSGSSRDTLSKVFDGGISERYSTPNFAEGRPTGFLQIDADLNAMRNRRRVIF